MKEVKTKIPEQVDVGKNATALSSEGTGDYLYDPIKYVVPIPKYCMVLCEVKLSYAVVYKDHIQFVQGHNTSPSVSRDDARNMIRGLDDVKRIVDAKKFGMFETRNIPIGFTRNFSIGTGHCNLGNFSIHGNESIERFKGLLNAFIWNKSRNEMGPFINDFDHLRIVSQIDRFGEVSKFITWGISINDDLSPDERIRLTVASPFDGFRYHLSGAILAELIFGIKALLNSDINDYQFKDPKAFSDGLRIWKHVIPNGAVAVGISTNLLLPNQRTFLFLGKESGNSFLKLLRKAKILNK